MKDVQAGLVWATKILTDPFHDIKLYYKAPLHLLRGELIDPTSQRSGRTDGSSGDRCPVDASSRDVELAAAG